MLNVKTKKSRRKSIQDPFVVLAQFREKTVARLKSFWIWFLDIIVFFNPYYLWTSKDLWDKLHLWFCYVKTRFTVNSSERAKLLEWVQTKTNRIRALKDFSSDWKDGVVLCALVEGILPGTCPRYDLLNPDHALSNVKLGLGLIEQHTGIKPSLTAEEVCKSSPGIDRRLMCLVSQLKLISVKMKLKAAIKRPVIKVDKEVSFGGDQECFAKGMGLILAVKGRKARFNIYFHSMTNMNIVIEIRGPQNSVCSERITSRSPKKKSPLSLSSAPLIKPDSADQEKPKIPFEYEIHAGKVAVSYIPVANGKHKLSIIWQGQHIMGSPYTVNVDDSVDVPTEKLSSQVVKKFLVPPGKRSSSPDLVRKTFSSKVRPPLPPLLDSTGGQFSKKHVIGTANANSVRNTANVGRKLGNVLRRTVIQHVLVEDGEEIIIKDSEGETLADALKRHRKAKVEELKSDTDDPAEDGEQKSDGKPTNNRKTLHRQSGVNNEEDKPKSTEKDAAKVSRKSSISQDQPRPEKASQSIGPDSQSIASQTVITSKYLSEHMPEHQSEVPSGKQEEVMLQNKRAIECPESESSEGSNKRFTSKLPISNIGNFLPVPPSPLKQRHNSTNVTLRRCHDVFMPDLSERSQIICKPTPSDQENSDLINTLNIAEPTPCGDKMTETPKNDAASITVKTASTNCFLPLTASCKSGMPPMVVETAETCNQYAHAENGFNIDSGTACRETIKEPGVLTSHCDKIVRNTPTSMSPVTSPSGSKSIKYPSITDQITELQIQTDHESMSSLNALNRMSEINHQHHLKLDTSSLESPLLQETQKSTTEVCASIKSAHNCDTVISENVISTENSKTDEVAERLINHCTPAESCATDKISDQLEDKDPPPNADDLVAAFPKEDDESNLPVFSDNDSITESLTRDSSYQVAHSSETDIHGTEVSPNITVTLGDLIAPVADYDNADDRKHSDMFSEIAYQKERNSSDICVAKPPSNTPKKALLSPIRTKGPSDDPNFTEDDAPAKQTKTKISELSNGITSVKQEPNYWPSSCYESNPGVSDMQEDQPGGTELIIEPPSDYANISETFSNNPHFEQPSSILTSAPKSEEIETEILNSQNEQIELQSGGENEASFVLDQDVLTFTTDPFESTDVPGKVTSLAGSEDVFSVPNTKRGSIETVSTIHDVAILSPGVTSTGKASLLINFGDDDIINQDVASICSYGNTGLKGSGDIVATPSSPHDDIFLYDEYFTSTAFRNDENEFPVHHLVYKQDNESENVPFLETKGTDITVENPEIETPNQIEQESLEYNNNIIIVTDQDLIVHNGGRFAHDQLYERCNSESHRAIEVVMDSSQIPTEATNPFKSETKDPFLVSLCKYENTAPDIERVNTSIMAPTTSNNANMSTENLTNDNDTRSSNGDNLTNVAVNPRPLSTVQSKKMFWEERLKQVHVEKTVPSICHAPPSEAFTEEVVSVRQKKQFWETLFNHSQEENVPSSTTSHCKYEFRPGKLSSARFTLNGNLSKTGSKDDDPFATNQSCPKDKSHDETTRVDLQRSELGCDGISKESSLLTKEDKITTEFGPHLDQRKSEIRFSKKLVDASVQVEQEEICSETGYVHPSSVCKFERAEQLTSNRPKIAECSTRSSSFDTVSKTPNSDFTEDSGIVPSLANIRNDSIESNPPTMCAFHPIKRSRSYSDPTSEMQRRRCHRNCETNACVFWHPQRPSNFKSWETITFRINPFAPALSDANSSRMSGETTETEAATDTETDKGFIDDEIPDYASLFLGNYLSFTGLLNTEKPVSRRELLEYDFSGSESDSVYNAALGELLDNTTKEDDNLSEGDDQLPRPDKCQAFGAGVYYGQVGVKNHFQVRTQDAGRSNLTVGIQGPEQQDVIEITTTYIGDSMYEVMYEVAEPGYYVINVRWGDWSIPDSPFICKVTY